MGQTLGVYSDNSVDIHSQLLFCSLFSFPILGFYIVLFIN